MKLITLTTTTMLLGTALITHAQTETDRSRSATEGGLRTSEATRMNEGAQPDTTTERLQQRAEAAAERAESGLERAGERAETGIERAAERAETGAERAAERAESGAERAADRAEAGAETAAQRARRAAAGDPDEQPGVAVRDRSLVGQRDQNQPDWKGSQQEDMELKDVSSEVQQALREGAVGGEIDDEVTRIRYGNEELFRGKAEIAGGEELYVYVNKAGKLVKTQQEIEMENAPQAVRTAAERHDEARDVEKILREVADGKTSYIIQIDREGDTTQWIQMDDTGKVIKSHEQEE